VTSNGAVLNNLWPPVIITQPQSQTVSAGVDVILTVEASGNPQPTYQWKYIWAGGTITLTGETFNNYLLNNIDANTDGNFIVEVTNSQGSILSDTAKVVVKEAPKIINSPVSQTVTEGQRIILTVTASGIPAPTYQWKKNSVSISSATDTIYSIDSVQQSDAATYTVVVSNSEGSATSNGAVLTVSAALSIPTITAQPQSQTVTEGQTVPFAVTASGNPSPTYQWLKNGTNISSATGSIYSIDSVQQSDAATYTVVVSNSEGSATSNGAVLTVSAALSTPTITAQPQSQTVTEGQTVTLSVAASGNPTPTYQWKKDGIDIVGIERVALTVSTAPLLVALPSLLLTTTVYVAASLCWTESME